MARLLYCLPLLLATLMTLCQSGSGYKSLGQGCNPKKDECYPGSKCDSKTKICDCADSPDGKWKRTFQHNGKSPDCRLLPGSTCVSNTDQDFYRCVENAKCTMTRKGQDKKDCMADAPCDTGDWACFCKPGKKCLTKRVHVNAPAKRKVDNKPKPKIG